MRVKSGVRDTGCVVKGPKKSLRLAAGYPPLLRKEMRLRLYGTSSEEGQELRPP